MAKKQFIAPGRGKKERMNVIYAQEFQKKKHFWGKKGIETFRNTQIKGKKERKMSFMPQTIPKERVFWGELHRLHGKCPDEQNKLDNTNHTAGAATSPRLF